MDAYTLVLAPAGMWSIALYFFRCACSSLLATDCKAREIQGEQTDVHNVTVTSAQ